MNIATSARSPIPPLDASPPQAYPQHIIIWVKHLPRQLHIFHKGQ